MTAATVDRLAALSDAACAGLVARFRTTGFSADLIAEAERFAPGLLLGPRLPLLRWWLARRPEPGARLARLFKYEEPLLATEAHEALGPELAGALTDAGILTPPSDGTTVAARFMITPTAPDLWLLSDPLASGPDAVMGPGGGTQHLARLIPRVFTGAALDVGCGAGSLALVAAGAGARRAVGVDINERAVHIARFNARLNDLPAEFRVGDGVAPVAGETFDLVISQPPFVVRPPGEADRTFLFGGADGDELPRRLLREMAQVLAPGGRALALLQSPGRDDAPLISRMRAALAGAAVDLLGIGAKAPSLAAQASVFASFEDPALGARYEATVRRYLDHFASRGIRQFDGALIVLSQRPVSRPDPPDHPPRRYTIGIHVAHPSYDEAALDRYLRGLDLLALPADAFARASLRISGHASVSAEGVDAAPDGQERRVIRIDAPGIGAEWRVDATQLAVLEAINEAASIEGAVRALAPASDAAPSDVRELVLTLAREALVRGALQTSAIG